MFFLELVTFTKKGIIQSLQSADLDLKIREDIRKNLTLFREII
jgi:hypothetical protein